MLGTILETIKRLENREQLSKDDKELLEFLHSQAWVEINQGIVNLISYGDRLGWGKIEEKFTGMLNLIDTAKNK